MSEIVPLPVRNAASGLVPEAVRNMGIYFVASKGSGKSRALGRMLVKHDVLRGTPGLVIDPAGGTIDNLFDALLRLPKVEQAQAWQRIIYIDAGSTRRVVPFPLYYRLGDDEAAHIANRFLQVVDMLDPHLRTASIEGWNALLLCGMHTGMALSAMGGQISEAQDLLTSPNAHSGRIKALVEAGEIQRATADWLLVELPGLKPDLAARRTASFLQKAAQFTFSPTRKAMYAANAPGIDWWQVVNEGKTVLLDLRGLVDSTEQQFLLLWVLHYFMQFVMTRGAGRHRPIALTIDEVSVLTTLDAQSPNEPFARLLDSLLDIWARQGQVWVTIAHQETWQVSELMLNTLMGCGTRIVGRTSSVEAAELLGSHLFATDPHAVKRREPDFDAYGNIRYLRPVTWSLDEQRSEAAKQLLALGKFQFFVKRVDEEGGENMPVYRLNLTGLEPGAYPDNVLLASRRERLHQRTARPVEEVLSEIEARQRSWQQGRAVKQDGASAIVQDNAYDDEGFKVE